MRKGDHLGVEAHNDTKVDFLLRLALQLARDHGLGKVTQVFDEVAWVRVVLAFPVTFDPVIQLFHSHTNMSTWHKPHMITVRATVLAQRGPNENGSKAHHSKTK